MYNVLNSASPDLVTDTVMPKRSTSTRYSAASLTLNFLSSAPDSSVSEYLSVQSSVSSFALTYPGQKLRVVMNLNPSAAVVSVPVHVKTPFPVIVISEALSSDHPPGVASPIKYSVVVMISSIVTVISSRFTVIR